MGRESRNFYRRAFYVGISFPILRFIWDRREWFERLEYTPEEEAQALADETTVSNKTFFSPFVSSSFSSTTATTTAPGTTTTFIPIDKEKASTDFSFSTGAKEHFAQKIRQNQIGKLENAEVDVLVIGGGATGLFAALDATTRGLRVALVEQSDFGTGVTGSSTTLLHSGFKRAQSAIRQRDRFQLAQLMQDAGELRAIEKCAASSSSSNSSSSSVSVVNRMPAYFPMHSFTEIFDFCLCTVMFSLFTVLGGGLLPVARPVFPWTIRNQFADMQPSETDELAGGFLIPERKIDGCALSRSIAHTASEHGACVVNYARVIGLDCEEQQPRPAKSKFTGVTNAELQRRSMDSDGQPYPWFDTGVQQDYFMDEKIAKPTETEDESGNYFVSGVKERFRPVRLQEKDEDYGKMGLVRQEDLPFYSVHAAVVRDELTGKIFRIYPKYVLNCTGRWGDSIRRMFPVAQPQMFERWSSQFFVAAHHQDPRSEKIINKNSNNGSDSENQQNLVPRPALIAPRNHVDAKPLFVYPYNMMNNSNESQNNNKNNFRHEWSLIGPVDGSIDSADPYFASPEKHFVITGDPKTQSPSLWRELRSPRITPTDLAFIATAADIFGVHIDSGFTLVQPRVLCEHWPGNHPSLCRALRFGGAVDYRGMHQKIVHSVGTETVWSRKKAELMVDSYFIEMARNSQKKIRIPPCRTKKLALVSPSNANGDSKTTITNEQQENILLPLTQISEQEVRKCARFDGCATILDVLLRRKQDLFSSYMILPDSDKPAFFLCAEMATQRQQEIKTIGDILAQEWNWSRERLKSEIECANSHFERNSFAADS